MKNKSRPSRLTTQDIRVPVPKLNSPGFNQERLRSLTIAQVAVLLWHIYKCANDPDIGYLDANTRLEELVTKKLSGSVRINKRELESLLWAANMAEMQEFFWSPDNKSFKEFIQPLLFRNEAFDRTWNLLIDTKEYNRIRNETRYIKKIISGKHNKNKGKQNV